MAPNDVKFSGGIIGVLHYLTRTKNNEHGKYRKSVQGNPGQKGS